MPEIRTLTSLIATREEIERSISKYESRLEQAHADLSHISVLIRISEASGDRDSTTIYTDIHRLFQRGELTNIRRALLAQHGPLNTRALVTNIF